MDFPTTEPEITALCDQMVNGYYGHAADFPRVSFIYRILLRNAGRSYISARKALVEAYSKLRIATKIKNEKLLELKNIMKQSLQKSEVDVAANPEKLKLIGWAPKANRQPARLPTQPTNLQITANENQVVTLKWVRPEDNQRVRNYCIERRQQNGEGISDWTIVHISYITQATLRNQPTGVQLEYRIRAANNTGNGPASNTVAIVL